ncbi:MAG: hypothetical protein R3362_11175, partial [Rhodothermales bacterium]|nr:hypothetical protein [Rhodothermales bacterium]
MDETPCYAMAFFGDRTVYAVPFELWQVSRADGGAEEVRMIPFIFPNGEEDGTFDWTSGTDFYDGLPASDLIYGLYPDLEAGGYDAFAAAAAEVGVGNAPEGGHFDDGVENVSPATGEPCSNQGNYVLYCYRNDELTGFYPGGGFGATFVYPIGRLQFADLDEDGEGPPVGTVVRLHTEGEPNPVDAEDGAPVAEGAGPELLPAWPNPSRGAAE